MAKRIDVIPGNTYTIKKKFDKIGYPDTPLRKIYVVQSGSYYIGANKEVPEEIIQRLQRALVELKASSFIRTLHGQYKLDYNKKIYKENGFTH